MKIVGILLLVAIFLKGLVLYKTLSSVPLAELRRRARGSRDPQARALYKLASYKTPLWIFMWFYAGVSGVALLALLAGVSWWLVLISVLLLVWILLSKQLVVRPGSWLWQIAGPLANLETYALSFLQPALSRLSKLFENLAPHMHTGLYEKEDLLELLQRQSGLVDNRISEAELKAARGALSFGDKLVSSIMTPRKKIAWVNQNDSIGPKLMDDLHQTGQTRFPVLAADSKPVNADVVGTLYLQDLLKNLEKPGTVGGVMKKSAHFINESDDLLQALDGFLKSGQHLLVVVNNFEEVVGVLKLEDVLGQILGHPVADEFDQYHNKHAVAGHERR